MNNALAIVSDKALKKAAQFELKALFVLAVAFLGRPALTYAPPVTTLGFLNQPRGEAPGTLLSHPVINDSERIGRTTSINYLNGWLIVGAELPGSLPGSLR